MLGLIYQRTLQHEACQREGLQNGLNRTEIKVSKLNGVC